MVRKIFYLLFFLGILVSTVSAQTIQWLVKPGYNTISRLNGTIFKCKTKDWVQLFDATGKALLSSPTDSITDYCENLALILDKSGGRYRIRGVVNGYGDFTQVKGEYYANSYSFYSERLVSVDDASGKAGYLNENGILVVPCQYRIARPFIKGWASVELSERKKQTVYINRQQETLAIPEFHDGMVIMGSSFNSSGEALVAYYGNDNAVINTEGQVVRKYERKGGVEPIRTYDFAFEENGKNSIQPIVTNIKYDKEPFPFVYDGLFGYKKENRIVVLPQFSQAGRFVNGNAIVCLGNKYGVVKLAKGSFSGEFVGEDLIVAAGKQTPTYTYNLVIPESIKVEALQVMFDIGDGEMNSVDLQDGKYEFTPFIEENADVCVMKMQVMLEGLLLWADSLVKNVTSVSLDISSPVALSERANEQDEIHVQSVITNNSNLSVVVSGAFYVNFAKGSKNKMGQKKTFSGKIGPKSKMEVFADLNVVEEESAKVSVSVKVNQKSIGTKSATILLKPFY